jgi:hypothetical protein
VGNDETQNLRRSFFVFKGEASPSTEFRFHPIVFGNVCDQNKVIVIGDKFIQGYRVQTSVELMQYVGEFRTPHNIA